jgi:hypothetical protein
MKVLLAYGPALRDETRHELAVAAVWNAEAFPELAFFERELESELGQVEGGDQHQSPVSREQRRAQDQAEVPVVERVTHVPIRSLYHQPLRNAILLGASPWGNRAPASSSLAHPIFTTAHVPATTEPTKSTQPSTWRDEVPLQLHLSHHG